MKAPIFDDEDRIEMLFLATVSRFPTDEEMQRCIQYTSSAPSGPEKQRAQGDLLWALLNTAECAVCP